MRRLAAVALLAAAPASARQDPPEWTRASPPFHLVGPIWYVGTEGLASYLIKTRDGAILLDGTMAENVARVRRNIELAGVPIRRVRVLLLSHAHFDHAGGLAGLEKASGARVIVGARDAEAVRTGVPPGQTEYGVIRFPASRVDRAILDGETVSLGGVTLTAIATPGHTPGCTTWTMQVLERGKSLSVVFPCSVSVAGNLLVGNRRYPGIVTDFHNSFARLARLKADIVLPAHPELADVRERAAAGTLVAPRLLEKLVADARSAFEAELSRQQAAVPK